MKKRQHLSIGQMRFDFQHPGLFVDFHGTLSAAQFWSNLPDPSLRRDVQAYMFSDRADLVNKWLLGDVSSKHVTDIICKQFDLEEEALWQKFRTHSQRLSMSGLDQLRFLRGHFSVALVTVNVDTFTSITATSRQLHRFVDAIVNSADMNALKEAKDGSLFHHASTMVGAKIENSLLIDDLEKACQAFRKLGGHAIKVACVKDTVFILNLLVNKLKRDLDVLTARSTYALIESAYSMGSY